MAPKDKIEQLFLDVKKGNYEASAELFETIWINHTTLPHAGIQPVLDEMFKWAKSHQTQHPDFLAHTNLAKGTIALHSDLFDDALQYCATAHQLFSEMKDEDGMAACDIYSGFVYRSIGEIDVALKFGLEGIEQLTTSGKYKVLHAIGNYWVGGVYAETTHYDEALKLFNAGLQMNYGVVKELLGARFTNAIAGVYMKQKKYNLALENYARALQMLNDLEPTFKGRGLTDLGDYYFTMGDYNRAIQYNEEALAFRRDMNILNGSITNLINLGDIFTRQGKFTEAILRLNDALKLSEEIRVKSKMFQVHRMLSDIYLAMGNLQESMGHYKAFHEIREDVNHEDTERKVKNQQRLFEAEQTRKENAIIKAQKQEIEHKNHQLEETIEELTITKVSRRAKAITLVIAVALIVIDTTLHRFVVSRYAHDNYFILLASEGFIVLMLKPIENLVEHYLLSRLVKSRRAKATVIE